MEPAACPAVASERRRISAGRTAGTAVSMGHQEIMKAAVLHAKQDLRIEDRDKPSIADDEILVRVRGSFVCGTDVRMFRNGHDKGLEEDGLIIGHEMSGVVAEVGSAVQRYEPGMRVAIAPNMGCGKCDLCVSGDSHLCADYRALGIHFHGGFADHVRIPRPAIDQGNIVPISEHVSFEEAALVEPLSCVFNGFCRCAIDVGNAVLVFGAGPIGIMHAMLARMAGAAPVILTDISEERLAQAKSIDPAFEVVNGADLQDKVMALTKGKGTDVGVTACPAPEAQVLAVELAAMNGRVLFFGGLPADKAKVGLDANRIHYRQLIVTGTARASLSQYRKSLELVERGLLNLEPLVTSRCSLDDLPDVLSNAATGLKTAVDLGEH